MYVPPGKTGPKKGAYYFVEVFGEESDAGKTRI